MKYLSVLLFFIMASSSLVAQNVWKNLAVTENTEIYIDSASVLSNEGQISARVKTVYTTESSRQAYIKKIKNIYQKNADKKIKKWEGFSYNITYGIYDCSNKRFKVLEVEDFTSGDKRIVKTKTNEKKVQWIFVDTDTVGDYILYYICDGQY